MSAVVDFDLRARAYSPAEAGERLSLSGQTVRRLCRAGEIGHRKVGDRFVIPHVALVEFLEGPSSSESTAASATTHAEQPQSAGGGAPGASDVSPTGSQAGAGSAGVGFRRPAPAPSQHNVNGPTGRNPVGPR